MTYHGDKHKIQELKWIGITEKNILELANELEEMK